MSKMSRREMLAAGTAGLWCGPMLRSLLAAEEKPSFSIGACDWSIGAGGSLKAMEIAKQLGLDGVEVSFGAPGGQTDLRKEEVRAQYKKAADENGLAIASLAMGVLNRTPYSSDEQAEKWVEACVDVMTKMGQKRVLLAFFGSGDIKGKPELQKEVIRRLKRVAPKAEKAGVVLGLETWLDADDHLRILDAVGSPAVQVYYDVANMTKQGYDICKEIRRLGKRICQFHMKENGHLLGKGKVDFPKVKEAINEIGYRGWLVIESARPRGMSLQEAYTANQKYLRSVFPTGK
jgi:L-ribulose-5-phosphate 3-epimerase